MRFTLTGKIYVACVAETNNSTHGMATSCSSPLHDNCSATILTSLGGFDRVIYCLPLSLIWVIRVYLHSFSIRFCNVQVASASRSRYICAISLLNDVSVLGQTLFAGNLDGTIYLNVLASTEISSQQPFSQRNTTLSCITM